MVKVVFFGTPDFAVPVLKTLEENFDVLKAIRKPQQFDYTAIQQLKDLHPDLFIVTPYGVIFPKEVLNIPEYGSINIHPSHLPRYRGASPIQTQILEGVKKSAITFIKMDEEVDHGPILKTIPFEILDSDTFKSTRERVFKKAAKTLPQIINQYIKGDLKPTPQNDSQASYTKLLKREDGYLNIDNLPETSVLERMIRAYHPWPSVWTRTYLGGRKLIVKFLPGNKVQVEGKNPMSFKDFVNGYKEGAEILKKLKINLLSTN